jgi:hypothetical protein
VALVLPPPHPAVSSAVAATAANVQRAARLRMMMVSSLVIALRGTL